MTKPTDLNHDEISYLLNKIEWPQPSSDLAYRIQSAAVGDLAVPFMGDMSVVHFKSPVLTLMAVVLALFLGVASGMATGGTAAANEMEHPYGSSVMSVTGIYSGHMQ